MVIVVTVSVGLSAATLAWRLANNNAEACTTQRCGNDVERAIRSSSARCLRDTFRGAAVITGMPQH